MARKYEATTRKGRMVPPPAPMLPRFTMPAGSRVMLGPVARGAPNSGQLLKPKGNSNQAMLGTTLKKKDR
jgi:hypothetical protein